MEQAASGWRMRGGDMEVPGITGTWSHGAARAMRLAQGSGRAPAASRATADPRAWRRSPQRCAAGPGYAPAWLATAPDARLIAWGGADTVITMGHRDSHGNARGRGIGRLAVVVLLWCWACSSGGSLTTDTDSQSLPDRQQRLEFLARYLRLRSPVSDAEYIIRYQDNSGGGVPGPSDWDIRAVLQVERESAAWHEGWVACADGAREPAVDTAWAAPLLGRRPPWKALRSSPRCYRDPNAPASFAIVYEEDGLVLYRNTSERGAAAVP